MANDWKGGQLRRHDDRPVQRPRPPSASEVTAHLQALNGRSQRVGRRLRSGLTSGKLVADQTSRLTMPFDAERSGLP